MLRQNLCICTLFYISIRENSLPYHGKIGRKNSFCVVILHVSAKRKQLSVSQQRRHRLQLLQQPRICITEKRAKNKLKKKIKNKKSKLYLNEIGILLPGRRVIIMSFKLEIENGDSLAVGDRDGNRSCR